MLQPFPEIFMMNGSDGHIGAGGTKCTVANFSFQKVI